MNCFRDFVHPSRRDDAELRQLVHDMGDDIGVEAFIRQQTAVMAGRTRGRRWRGSSVRRWCCPATRTTPSRIRCRSEMADGIPGAKLVILPNCGHLPQPEQPQATTDALVEWLRI